jgi:hypothetical protein
MKILQISDCHIKNYEEDLVYGTNPRNKLELIVNRILVKVSHFDFIVVYNARWDLTGYR